MVRPFPDEQALLEAVASRGGYAELPPADEGAADRCMAAGWLIPEGGRGFALTLDGWCVLRAGAQAVGSA
jgi:hypothetical protein